MALLRPQACRSYLSSVGSLDLPLLSPFPFFLFFSFFFFFNFKRAHVLILGLSPSLNFSFGRLPFFISIQLISDIFFEVYIVKCKLFFFYKNTFRILDVYTHYIHITYKYIHVRIRDERNDLFYETRIQIYLKKCKKSRKKY